MKMPLLPRRLLGFLALAAVATHASAVDWQSVADHPNLKFDVDADSVRVDHGLAYYTYREQRRYRRDDPFTARTMQAVVDCAARKHADLLGSSNVELHDVFEGTDQASVLTLVCRLGHLATAEPHGLAAAPPPVPQKRPVASGGEDWRTYDTTRIETRQLDANSVRAHDGLVWFNYRELHSYDAPEVFRRTLSAVVDCAGRRSADVENGRYTLRDILEHTQQSAKLELACQLANAPTAAATAPAAPPVPPAPPAPRYSQADADLLWEEAAYTFDGLAYDYTTYKFATQDEATRCLADWQCAIEVHRLEVRTGQRSNEMAPWLRAAVTGALADERCKPVQDPATQAWIVVRVTARRPGKFAPNDVDRVAWLEMHAATALPTPDALRSDPAIRRRSAMNRVFTAERLHSSLAAQDFAAADLDHPLSNGGTLLIRALARHDQALADALVAAGASVQACGPAYCPIELVVSSQDHAGLRWLIAHGARVDRAPERPGTLPPLVLAVMAADKDSAQILLDANADPLVSVTDTAVGLTLQRSLAYYVPSQQGALLDWIYEQMARADARAGRYEWKAWIEQGGRRQPIVDGATITLLAQPFRIVMKAPDDTSMRVLASEDADFLPESRSGLARRAMLAPGRVGAVAPDSHFLAVGAFATRRGVHAFDGSSIELSWRPAPKTGDGTKRVADKHGGHEDVHEVVEFVTPDATFPATDFARHTIHVLLGPLPDHGTASDLYKPARFDIAIQ